MPHFDQHGHYTRHENLQRSRHGRRKVERTVDDLDYGGGSDPLVRAVMMCGVLGIILATGTMFHGGTAKPVKKKEGDDG